MCLDIKTSHHPYIKPLIAGYDILVYKGLVVARKTFAESPYMAHKWYFGRKQKGELEAVESLGTVEFGFHACLTKDRARYHAGGGVYPAVIPAGSKFFFGHHNEIVSDTLIVYADMDALLKGRILTDADVTLHKLAP